MEWRDGGGCGAKESGVEGECGDREVLVLSVFPSLGGGEQTLRACGQLHPQLAHAVTPSDSHTPSLVVQVDVILVSGTLLPRQSTNHPGLQQVVASLAPAESTQCTPLQEAASGSSSCLQSPG